MDKIICVGKNYVEHAREMDEVLPEKPVLFLKPPSVMCQASQWGETLTLNYPDYSGEIQPECEIVIRIKNDGYALNMQQALTAIDAVTLGLDMTFRTRQTQLKKQGHPWTTAKVFPQSAILAPWIALEKFRDYLTTDFCFYIDDQLCQLGHGNDMCLLPVDLIVYISHFFPLCAGDIIFTGTPAGVSAIQRGSNATLQWQENMVHVGWR